MSDSSYFVPFKCLLSYKALKIGPVRRIFQKKLKLHFSRDVDLWRPHQSMLGRVSDKNSETCVSEIADTLMTSFIPDLARTMRETPLLICLTAVCLVSVNKSLTSLDNKDRGNRSEVKTTPLIG